MGDRGAYAAYSMLASFNTLASFFYFTPRQKHKPHNRFERVQQQQARDSILLRGGAGAGDIQERDIQ
jgi:hypothetical protein